VCVKTSCSGVGINVGHKITNTSVEGDRLPPVQNIAVFLANNLHLLDKGLVLDDYHNNTDPWMTYAVVAGCGFLALAVIHVNMALLAGVIFFLLSFQWGGMQSETAHIITNEKLLGELFE